MSKKRRRLEVLCSSCGLPVELVCDCLKQLVFHVEAERGHELETGVPIRLDAAMDREPRTRGKGWTVQVIRNDWRTRGPGSDTLQVAILLDDAVGTMALKGQAVPAADAWNGALALARGFPRGSTAFARRLARRLADGETREEMATWLRSTLLAMCKDDSDDAHAWVLEALETFPSIGKARKGRKGTPEQRYRELRAQVSNGKDPFSHIEWTDLRDKVRVRLDKVEVGPDIERRLREEIALLSALVAKAATGKE